MDNLTPMMKQYWKIKNQHTDAILFFRLGDFYEMFFDDAKESSKLLGLTLTGRSCGQNEKAPMCGIPYHSANGYIQKLIQAGKKIAICEQTQDPESVKGIVERSVVRIITPGTYINEDLTAKSENNYILSIVQVKNNGESYFEVAYSDVSTGEFSGGRVEYQDFLDTFSRIHPKEIIADSIFLKFLSGKEKLAKQLNLIIESTQILISPALQVNNHAAQAFSKDIELQELELSLHLRQAIDALLNYILDTQKIAGNNMNHFQYLKERKYLKLDYNTRRNLELIEGYQSRNKKHSLLGILDDTKTPMGSRTLRKWIENPLRQQQQIEERLDIIESFVHEFALREDLRAALNGIYDLERLCAKISYEHIHPKELVQIRESLKAIPAIVSMIEHCTHPLISKTFENIDPLDNVRTLLENALLDNPSLNIREGDVIRTSFSKELQELRYIEKNSTQVLKNLEEKERITTGIKNLKIGYNKVFGYYIEISKSNLKDFILPPGYIRKQTLSNAERYINEELKIIEEQVLTSKQKISDLQVELYSRVKKQIYENITRILKTAQILGNLDAFLSLSSIASVNNFIRPSLNDNKQLFIKDGRHPVIEQLVESQHFVPNDTLMNKTTEILIITGPNMGGKSTYMRQTAILCIMAHMGSFIPAQFANICILDAIYTRVGASDDLSQGQSTFMVEMNEVAYILDHASENSLVILDEVGRGTSTYDGMSIAWAILEYIAKTVKSKTLFSTHYHELTELESKIQGVQNLYVAVEEKDESIQFLRKVLPGKGNKSYGLHVAQLAEIPLEVISLANSKLIELENSFLAGKKTSASFTPNTFTTEISESIYIPSSNNKKTIPENQLTFYFQEQKNDKYFKKLIQCLKEIDLDDTTPRKAYQYLEELQALIRSLSE